MEMPRQLPRILFIYYSHLYHYFLIHSLTIYTSHSTHEFAAVL